MKLKIKSQAISVLFFASVIGWQFDVDAKNLKSSKATKSGIYLVLRSDRNKSNVEPVLPGEKVLLDDGRFLEESERDPLEYVVVQEKSFIPFKLDQKPVEGYTDDKKPKVYLQFANKQAQDLDALTGNNIGKRIALVIDDQIVSCHKIRQALKGGKMQISRCTKESCKLIFSDLLKDHTK